MSRIFIALLLVTTWPDGQAQSSRPWCPADKPVFQWTDCVASITFPDGEKFFGEYQDGKRNGMGRYTFKDGGQYVGQWRDGKRNGEGVRYKPDGTIESSGLWKDGKFEPGSEIEKSRYPFNGPRYPIVSDVGPGATNLVMSAPIGFLSEQQQSSLPRCASSQLPQQWTDCYGTETYPNGAKYVGEWHAGQRDGYGVMTFPDGTIFTGKFESGNREGKGSLAYKNGTVFFGYFERDAAPSHGMFVYPNGQRYIGEVKDLNPPYQKSVSQRYFGEYSDYQCEGDGILYLANGLIAKSGKWKKGRLVNAIILDPSRFPFDYPEELSRREAKQGKSIRSDASAPDPEVQSHRDQPKVHSQATPTPQASPSRQNQQLRRVALIIGNARYANAPILNNPPADAASIAAALREADFQTVTVKTDLSHQALLNALREFALLADTADWAVVYYAGHGIEFGGVNYLIPTDARLKADRDIDLEGVDLGKVMAAVEGAKRLRLIILDACRDNPFANQMRRTMASRSLGRGLARVEPEPGTLVAYAAKHGETADDGTGTRNSPFAEAFVKRIKQTPPIEVRRLFDYVRDDVLKATNKRQQPFSYGSISAEEDFYFLLPK